MFTDNSGIYGKELSPGVRAALEQLTQPRSWDYEQFRQVMIFLAKLPSGSYVPATHRPESVHLQGPKLGLYGHFQDMAQRTRESGLEHAMTMFADVGSDKIIMGQVTRGFKRKDGGQGVLFSTARQPGRHHLQKPIGLVHTHPELPQYVEYAKVFGHEDYKTFLNSRDFRVAFLVWGEHTLMVLKTSVTANNLSTVETDRRLQDAHDDYISKRGDGAKLWDRVMDFNKVVCTEFGLTLYMGDGRSKALLTRQDVTGFKA